MGFSPSMNMTFDHYLEYEMRDRGFTHFKPAYYELTDEERHWLQIGCDPQQTLEEVLKSLPTDELISYCRCPDYDTFGEISGAEDAEDCAWDLAGYMYADVVELGLGKFELVDKFPIPIDSLDKRLQAVLMVLGREVHGDFYE